MLDMSKLSTTSFTKRTGWFGEILSKIFWGNNEDVMPDNYLNTILATN
jgi:hypothetical protein